MNSFSRPVALLLALGLLAPAAHAELTPAQRVEDFESFWETYKGAYVFFDLKKEDHGVDWEAIKARMLPRLQNSTSDLDLYLAVTEAQASLRDGHCYNGAFQKIRETDPIFFQRIQFQLAEERKVAVSVVPPGSVFDEAGIEAGDELVQFDGQSMRQMAEDARALQGASSDSQFWHNFAGQLYIHDPLSGPPAGETATLVFLKASGEQVTVSSPWNMAPPTGAPEEDPAPEGAPRAPSSSRRAPGDGLALTDAEALAAEGPLPMDVRLFKDFNIGYLAIETWMKTEDPFEQMESVMTALAGTDGLVVDMRGNGGGVGTWGVLFANYFLAPGEKGANDSWMDRLLSKAFFGAAFEQVSDEDLEQIFTDPATMQYVLTQAFGMDITAEQVEAKYFENGRFQPFYLRLPLNDKANTVPAYTKPVYVLTDGGCYSTTDIFLTILDEFDRVEIVGTPNGAGSGSPIPFELPNSGLTVYVPHARAYPPKGSMIEGRPRAPTIPVSPTMADLKTGRDTILVTAVQALWSRLHPQVHGFVGGAPTFRMVEATQLMGNPRARTIDWGNIPTPDWAIDAKIRQAKLRDLLSKR